MNRPNLKIWNNSQKSIAKSVQMCYTPSDMKERKGFQMKNEKEVKVQFITVKDAQEFCDMSSLYQGDIYIGNPPYCVDGKSVLGILSLGTGTFGMKVVGDNIELFLKTVEKFIRT